LLSIITLAEESNYDP